MSVPVERLEASGGAKAPAIWKEMPAMKAAFRLVGIEASFAGGAIAAGEALVQCSDEGTAQLLVVLERRGFV